MGWTLRLRGPKGTPAQLVLPDGAETTLATLRIMAGKATNVKGSKVVVRGGYPPKLILAAIDDEAAEADAAAAEEGKTVAQAGMANMDTLMIERFVEEGGGNAAKPGESAGAGSASKDGPGKASGRGAATQSSSSDSPAKNGQTTRSGRATTATGERMAAMDKVAKEREDMANKEGKKRSAGDAPSKAAGKKKVKMPGVGRRLDDGEVVAGAPPAPAPAPRAWQFAHDDTAKSGSKAARANKSLMGEADVMALGSIVNESEAAQMSMAANLVDAFSEGKSGNPLRISLKNARAQQGAIERASARYRAAMAGEVEFKSKQVAVMGSGNAVSIWEVFWKNGRNQMSELASNFPLPVVKGIIQQLIDDPDPVMRSNVKPHNMACVSARVFWNVVRLGDVGPNKSFETALREMLPDANWDVLLSRNQAEKEEGFYRVTAGGRAGSGRGGGGGAKSQQGASAGEQDAEGEAQVEGGGEGDEEIDLREEDGALQEEKEDEEEIGAEGGQ